jgi:hypothetical protein
MVGVPDYAGFAVKYQQCCTFSDSKTGIFGTSFQNTKDWFVNTHARTYIHTHTHTNIQNVTLPYINYREGLSVAATEKSKLKIPVL